jgi:hypothetical protein
MESRLLEGEEGETQMGYPGQEVGALRCGLLGDP